MFEWIYFFRDDMGIVLWQARRVLGRHSPLSAFETVLMTAVQSLVLCKLDFVRPWVFREHGEAVEVDKWVTMGGKADEG